MTKDSSKPAARIVFPFGHGPVVIEGSNVVAEIDGDVITVTSGRVELTGTARLSGSMARPLVKVGQAKLYGTNKGWIHCETDTGEPFLVAPADSGVMKWQRAIAYAARENAALPSHDELKAMYDSRDTGKFRDTFNTTGSQFDGWYWSASHRNKNFAQCRDFGEGGDYGYGTGVEMAVRLVRRYSIG